MLGESILGRATRKAAARAVGSGLDKLAQRVRDCGGAPLAVVLPGGTRIDFGANPKVVFKVRDDAALATLAQPSLDALGEAYVEGRIDLDGDMMEALAVADRLASAGGAPAGARLALLLGRHPVQQDRRDVQYHYDVGNDFYRLGLDERM
ncbi:MAG: hypothetical protein ACK6DI_17030, partial [Betaproteobacteria bacterium]